MKRILVASLAALMLCSACLFEDIGFEDCDCDDASFASPAGN